MQPEDLGVAREVVEYSLQIRAIVSAVFIVLVLGIRWLVVREIRRRAEVITDVQRWWISAVKNIATGVMLLGLIAVWATEIADFALSITAFAVALVFALRELLQCFLAAIWRGTSRPFEVGDWVQIGEHSGDVIEETLLVTVLQEIDPRDLRYTGRTVTVPNALLLTNQIVNNNFRKNFLLHVFTLVSEPAADALAVRDAILGALRREAESFRDLAERYAGMVRKRTGVALPDIAPAVVLGTTDFANVTYRVSVFCPRERALDMEQAAAEALVRALSAGGEQARPGAARVG